MQVGGALTVVVVHRRVLVREALVALLNEQPDVRVIAHVTGIQYAIRLVRSSKVDCVLVEYRSGDENNPQFSEGLTQISRKSSVLVIGDHVPQTVGDQLTKTGVKAIVPYTTAAAALVDELRHIADTGADWPEPLVAQTRPFPSMTNRQFSVLQLVYEGLSNKEISFRIGVSDSSVKCTVKQLFSKWGAKSRSQLLRSVLEYGGLPKFPKYDAVPVRNLQFLKSGHPVSGSSQNGDA
jgi:two-component system nitrate/nitrite response regulator NarL